MLLSLLADLEAVLHMIGAAATKLRKRLDLNCKSTNDDPGRTFSGLHHTVLPLCSNAGSMIQQLCICTTGCDCTTGITENGRSKGQRTDSDEAPGFQIKGRPSGRVTGVDLRHLLLLLPFLLFDLLYDEV